MLKTDPKEVPSQKYGFACSSRYNDLTFYEKKISQFTIPLMISKKVPEKEKFKTRKNK